MTLAPRDGVVLSLAGFIRLAYRHYSEAHELFVRAIIADPRLGEPHLGLAIYNFRFRNMDRGLAEMLLATLLEPRLSSYQSELGKALYQVRSFDKALHVYDYAKTLDPNDPTPYLYKGIALTDLNRPGEAIQEINRSIELNDNRAVYRTRLALNRDRAVRNYNLARSYNQLGLGEWAYSKAVTAVNHDPTNSSAHLFLSKSFTKSESMAAEQELLLFRVLSPANQNTFMNLAENDYTPMFEMPYNRITVQGGIGSWNRQKTIQDQEVYAYGGLPGAAYYLSGDSTQDQGFRGQNSDSQHLDYQAGFKLEPAVNGTLTGIFQNVDGKRGDISNLNDWRYSNDPALRLHDRLHFYELSYVHRFTPQATFLTYGTFQNWKNHQILPFTYTATDPFSGGIFTDNLKDVLKSDYEYHNFQLQQQLVLGDHSFIAGFDYFAGHVKYNERLYDDFGLIGQDDNTPPLRSNSFYLMDYWRLSGSCWWNWGFQGLCQSLTGRSPASPEQLRLEPACRDQLPDQCQPHPSPGRGPGPELPHLPEPLVVAVGDRRLSLGLHHVPGPAGAPGRGGLGSAVGPQNLYRPAPYRPPGGHPRTGTLTATGSGGA